MEDYHADDLVIMAHSEDGLWHQLLNWKSTLEAKGVKVNVSKTKSDVWRKVQHGCNRAR